MAVSPEIAKGKTMRSDVFGALVLALPALVMSWAALWRRQRPIFWFAAALILLGTGYLVATGAASDIGRRVAPGLVASSVPNAVPTR